MKQREFWKGFYEPLELGWWLQYHLEEVVLQSPEYSQICS